MLDIHNEHIIEFTVYLIIIIYGSKIHGLSDKIVFASNPDFRSCGEQ